MEFLLSGISIVTIGGFAYNFINLFLAKKTDTIFFTEGKKLLRNVVNSIVMIILMSISLYIIPLQFDHIIAVNDSLMNISGVLLSIIIVIIMILHLVSQIKYSWLPKLFVKLFYHNGIAGVIIYLLFWLYGLLIILKIAQFKNSFYINSKDIFGVSIIWAIISISFLYLYVSEYRKNVRQLCWIDFYDTDKTKPETYYIFYASDNEYVVCGKKDKYNENLEYRFIKISNIKEKYIIHFKEKKM